MMNHDLFRSSNHSFKMRGSILVESVTWMITKCGDVPLVETSQKDQILAPKVLSKLSLSKHAVLVALMKDPFNVLAISMAR